MKKMDTRIDEREEERKCSITINTSHPCKHANNHIYVIKDKVLTGFTNNHIYQGSNRKAQKFRIQRVRVLRSARGWGGGWR